MSYKATKSWLFKNYKKRGAKSAAYAKLDDITQGTTTVQSYVTKLGAAFVHLEEMGHTAATRPSPRPSERVAYAPHRVPRDYPPAHARIAAPCHLASRGFIATAPPWAQPSPTVLSGERVFVYLS